MASTFRQYIRIAPHIDDEIDTIAQAKEGGINSNSSRNSRRSTPAQIVSSAIASIHPILLTLPPPFNKHRRDNKAVFLLASFFLSLLVIRNIYLYNTNTILHPFRNPHVEDYRLAYDESNGFFNDVPSYVWMQKKDRVRHQPKHNDAQLGLRSKFMNRNKPKSWYQHNWDAEFTCPQERRVGGVSDGAKWICDPHRLSKDRLDVDGIHEDTGTGSSIIAAATRNRNSKKDNNNDNKKNQNWKTSHDDCLVYSFGRGSPITRIFDFAFEIDLLKTLGGEGSCEIHYFDHRLDTFGGTPPDGVILHPWGLEGMRDASKSRRNFMTLKETVHELKHEGRTVDIMRVDCEGCEWSTYGEWSTSGIVPRQIVVALHGAPGNEHNIFEVLEADGYVIFHREADVRYGGMWQEYGFLKLAPEFFE